MVEALHRIVSLAPSATEHLFFLGLGPKVVGVTEQCNWPEEATGRETIGSFASPDLEKIVSLKPDLVVAQRRIHDRYLEELRKRGIDLFLSGPKTIEDLFQEMERLCLRTGQPEPGKSRVRLLRMRVEAVQRNLPKGRRPKIFRLMVENPLYTPTSSSYQYDAILTAGGRPFPLDADDPYVQVPFEDVIRFNPEGIISCGRTRSEPPKARCPGCRNPNPPCQRVDEEIRHWKGWEEMEAVREGRILTLPCPLICRPGPRLIEGIEWMATFFQHILSP